MSSWYQPVDDTHIRRERAKARTLRASPWWKAQLAKGVCYHCGKTFSPNELTMDHLIPVARGGTSTKRNVVPSCFACNQAKAAQTPVEQILESLGFEDDIGFDNE